MNDDKSRDTHTFYIGSLRFDGIELADLSPITEVEIAGDTETLMQTSGEMPSITFEFNNVPRKQYHALLDLFGLRLLPRLWWDHLRKRAGRN